MDRRSFLGGLTASLVIGCSPSADPGALAVAVDLAAELTENGRYLAVDGSSFVVDRATHEIVKVAANGSELGRFGGLGTAVGELNGPAQIAFAPNGDLWVLDRGNQRLQRFDGDGRSVAVVPTGSGSSFAVGQDGRLVVADASLQRVQVLDAGGRELAEHALAGVPQAVAVDDGGRIAVAMLDGGVLSVEAEVAELVPAGTVGWPRGIAFHPDGRVVVADGQDNALRAYAPRTGVEVGLQRLYLDDGRVAQPQGVLSGAGGVHVLVQPGEV